MSTGLRVFISLLLLVLTITVESVYNPYLYDDGNGGEEHCCLVRVRKNFCIATPITRSLLQVNQQCNRFTRSQNRRFNRKQQFDDDLNKISRRLDVKTVQEMDDKILIELQKPLEKNILDNDLICLTSKNNHINLDQCYIELVDNDNYVSRREHKQRRHRKFNQKRRTRVETNEEEDATDDEQNEAKNELRRIELSHPIRIREGQGLFTRQKYTINPHPIPSDNRQERKCWSWYRRITRKMHQDSSKYFKTCVDINERNAKCLHQLIYNTYNHTEYDQVPSRKLSITPKSKLYCSNKLLGLYDHGDICFYPDNQVYIEHQFTDLASMSDMNKNQEILDFIENNSKLTAEFQDDCHGTTHLVETNEPKN